MESAAPDESGQHLLADAIELCDKAVSLYGVYSRRNWPIGLSEDSPHMFFNRKTLRQIGPDGDWPTDLGHRLLGRAFVYMSCARQHVKGLSALLRSEPFGLSTGPVTRSVTEAAGRTIWLLSHKVDLVTGTRQRVARLLLDEEDDARLYLRLVKFSGDQKVIEKTVKQHEQFNNRIRQPGVFYPSEIDISPKSGELLSIASQNMPGLSVFSSLALAPNEDPYRATLTYSYLSAMTHPTMTAAMESVGERLDNEEWLTPLAKNYVFVAKLVTTAVAAYLHAWYSLREWQGHSEDEYLEVEGDHGRLNVAIDAAGSTRSPG